MKYLFLPLVFLFALPAHAATVIVEPTNGEAAPGESFTLTVSLTADGEAVNASEGSVRIPSGVVVESVSAAGSLFTLWPSYPAFYTTDRMVEFSGGVPGGISSGTTGLLFTIRAHAERPGAYEFSPTGVGVYRNDGEGTPEEVNTKGALITVREGAKAPRVSTKEATPLVADIGQDAALFDGQYFVAFYGGDRGAGVRYEIREGTGDYVSADRYYVIRDQTLKTPITVRALDAEGVVQEVTLNQQPPYLLIVIVLLALVVLGALFMRRKKAVV